MYAEFGNKEGLGEALVRRETQRLLLGATAALRSRPDDAFAAMTDAASFILREAATSAVIAALLSPEGADGSLGLAYALPAGSGVIVPEMYDGLLAWFSEQCPRHRAGPAGRGGGRHHPARRQLRALAGRRNAR